MSRDTISASMHFICPHCGKSIELDLRSDWFTVDVGSYNEYDQPETLIAQKVCPECEGSVVLARSLA